ncbi:sugar MFS transporter [Gallalistipes aquisgranensis]|uniref:sugar MFS transporter n=1 Tax=Gallalistipes aquisgranensis TaxID=2779358 RepID=UPI001CF890C7|nr:sugar MFS transporter [Gallalistipes aquisgranensis]MBE5032377.1 sugar MFS transporter [Gallalistipes aquisgranensis]
MSNSNTVAPGGSDKKRYIVSMVILGSLFFIFGLVSWVNAILIPYFKIACELTYFQAYLVTFAFYIAYLVMSVPSSFLLNRVGYKRGIMIGLWIMALGALIFVPAALTRTYGIFLTGLFAIGTGLAILQTAANPYVTIIGPINSAAKRISMMGLCNKCAGIMAPLIFAALVLQNSDSETFRLLNEGFFSDAERGAVLDELIRRVILPYSCLAVILFVFGLLVRFSVLPEIDTDKDNASAETDDSHGKSSVFQFPYLILGALAIFFHVGAQVISIDTIIGYAQSMGLDLLEAKVFPSYVMTCTLIGYFLGIVLIPRVISQKRAFQICTVLGLVLSVAVLIASGQVDILGHRTDLSIWFIVPMGMANALIYAGIWPLAIRGLGRFTNLGSSLLVMGLCGNAFTPMIYGALADSIGVKMAYVVLIPCFLYLIFYAFVGHKITDWRKPKA